MSATQGLKAETVRTNSGGLWPGDKIKTELVARGIPYPRRGKPSQVAALRELLAKALEKEAQDGSSDGNERGSEDGDGGRGNEASNKNKRSSVVGDGGKRQRGLE